MNTVIKTIIFTSIAIGFCLHCNNLSYNSADDASVESYVNFVNIDGGMNADTDPSLDFDANVCRMPEQQMDAGIDSKDATIDVDIIDVKSDNIKDAVVDFVIQDSSTKDETMTDLNNTTDQRGMFFLPYWQFKKNNNSLLTNL